MYKYIFHYMCHTTRRVNTCKYLGIHVNVYGLFTHVYMYEFAFKHAYIFKYMYLYICIYKYNSIIARTFDTNVYHT